MASEMPSPGSNKLYTCEGCNRILKSATYYQHRRRLRTGQSCTEAKRNQFECPGCKAFLCQSQLGVHKRRRLKFGSCAVSDSSASATLICYLCEGRIATREMLIRHIRCDHKIQECRVESKEFDGKENAMAFCNDLRSGARYRLLRRDANVAWYVCSRDGVCRTQASEQMDGRAPKLSIRMGSSCTAYYKLISVGDRWVVQFCVYHCHGPPDKENSFVPSGLIESRRMGDSHTQHRLGVNLWPIGNVEAWFEQSRHDLVHVMQEDTVLAAVKQVRARCLPDCPLKCRYPNCGVCPHIYICTCMVSDNDEPTPCAHIHAVHIVKSQFENRLPKFEPGKDEHDMAIGLVNSASASSSHAFASRRRRLAAGGESTLRRASGRHDAFYGGAADDDEVLDTKPFATRDEQVSILQRITQAHNRYEGHTRDELREFWRKSVEYLLQVDPTDSDLLNTLPFLEAAVDSMNHDDDDDDEEEEEQDEDGADEFVEDHHEAEEVDVMMAPESSAVLKMTSAEQLLNMTTASEISVAAEEIVSGFASPYRTRQRSHQASFEEMVVVIDELPQEEIVDEPPPHLEAEVDDRLIEDETTTMSSSVRKEGISAPPLLRARTPRATTTVAVTAAPAANVSPTKMGARSETPKDPRKEVPQSMISRGLGAVLDVTAPSSRDAGRRQLAVVDKKEEKEEVVKIEEASASSPTRRRSTRPRRAPGRFDSDSE